MSVEDITRHIEEEHYVFSDEDEHAWNRQVVENIIAHKPVKNRFTDYEYKEDVMTEYQIKQNAEAYCDKDADILNKYGVYGWVSKAYVGGAHSRDAEIERLQKELAVAKDTILELRYRVKDVKNPWMDARESYPEEEDKRFGGGSSVPVYVRVQRKDGTVYHTVSTYYYKNNDDIQDGWCINRFDGEVVTHWMHIPFRDKNF
jgi:hypothetical protein